MTHQEADNPSEYLCSMRGEHFYAKPPNCQFCRHQELIISTGKIGLFDANCTKVIVVIPTKVIVVISTSIRYLYPQSTTVTSYHID